MGSGCSKDGSGRGSSSAGKGRGSRWRRRVFRSACLGLPQVLDDKNNDQEIGRSMEISMKSCQEDHNLLKFAQPEPFPVMDNSFRINGENQEFTSQNGSEISSISSIQDAQMMHSSSRSRFVFFPDGIHFRLSRAASLGSSSASDAFSHSFSIPFAEGDHQIHTVSEGSPQNRSRTRRERSIDEASAQDVVIHNPRSNFGTRRPPRRLQEPIEGTAQFSRTRSVGRLRDRVLRRTSLLEGRFGPVLSEEGSLGYILQSSERRYMSGVANISSERSDEMSTSSHPLSSISRYLDNSGISEQDTPQMTETSSHDTLEHRSAFSERRRRIRSQVRALRRLGSRFENFSGHDRSCILSGQHRTGRCTCRSSGRSTNSGENSNTRASISRIVMLAEALFEVLDEIHQQAVVLASRPSLSSIGSVPAPKEVVDFMPIKIYMKSQKQQNDDVVQCYICLVEYEEGDCLRVLPCGHEFHQTCVDKWLKEIHRVCPLCRGDVCISDASPVEELD